MGDRPLAPHRWSAPDMPDEVRHKMVFDYVSAIEQRQSDIQQQLYRNAYLYTGEELAGIQVDWQARAPGRADMPRINIVQSVVETAYSRIGSREPKLAVTTRGGDWELRQRAKGLEQFLGGTLHTAKFAREWAKSFKDGAALGTGLTKASRHEGEIRYDRTFPGEVIVDEAACRTTAPRALFQRRFPDVDELCADYPGQEDDIWKGATTSRGTWTSYIEYAPYHVPVIEAWQKNGLHLVCVRDKILFQEEWNRDWFPFIEIRWLEKLTGFYGIGIPEIVFFLQARVNRDETFITACQNRAVAPAVLVDSADQDLCESITNEVGQIIPWKGRQAPQFVTPPQVPPETYTDQARKINLIYQVSGMSEFATGAKNRPPTGLDSQPALAAWIDYSEGRFAAEEKQFDAGFVSAGEMAIELYREAASDGHKPRAMWNAPRFGLLDLDWADVNMKRDQYRLRILPASSTSETPAGLRQRLEEERAAGRMADDIYRYMVQTLDVEQTFNLYDAAVTDLMRTLYILSQVNMEFPAPSEYQALELGLWMCQMEWNRLHALDAPDKVLRRLSSWMELAQYIVDQGKGASAGPPQLGPAQAGGGQVAAPVPQDMSALPMPGLA